MAELTLVPWVNKIRRYGEVDPRTLLANPHNWRRHPPAQRAAITSSLTQLGWIFDVTINEVTGLLLDGHARVEEAVARGEACVPVKYVELTREEEALALLIIDRITGMATGDAGEVEYLMQQVPRADEGIVPVLLSLGQDYSVVAPHLGVVIPEGPSAPGQFPEYGENIPTEHTCPKCGYVWSGGT